MRVDRTFRITNSLIIIDYTEVSNEKSSGVFSWCLSVCCQMCLIYDILELMKKKISESQFTEAIFRHYYGESISSISKDFGVYPSTLSLLRKRRRLDWDRIENRIIDMELGRYFSARTDTETRVCLMALFRLAICGSKDTDILSEFCSEMGYSVSEAEGYIQMFESLFPLKIMPV